jgi:hypothetical protein
MFLCYLRITRQLIEAALWLILAQSLGLKYVAVVHKIQQ